MKIFGIDLKSIFIYDQSVGRLDYFKTVIILQLFFCLIAAPLIFILNKELYNNPVVSVITMLLILILALYALFFIYTTFILTAKRIWDISNNKISGIIIYIILLLAAIFSRNMLNVLIIFILLSMIPGNILRKQDT